jgi:hypothetical protein
MKRDSLMEMAAILTLAWVLAGCATVNSGYRISDETVAFIRPGVTTQSEVVENLGPPLYELKAPHVMAYSWGKVRVTAGAPAVQDSSRQPGLPSAPEPTPPVDSGSIESRRWICCIALDVDNRVTRFGRFELAGATSLESAVRQWAALSP